MRNGNGRETSALAHCAKLTEASGSNFYLAFLPMPIDRREGIFAVYAFCRVVDDIVDEPEAGVEPRRELDRWRERVRRITRGEALAQDEHPVAIGLEVTHSRFPLREDDLLAVIDGVEMDLDLRRYETSDMLALYCERVAGRVGCLCLPVFGAGDEARPYALVLGRAFQLTNILRDVPRDAAIGRLYLPLDTLALHGAREEDVRAGHRTPEVVAAMRAVGDEARGLFERADLLLPADERDILYPALIMSAIYRRVLEQLRALDFDCWSDRVSLPRSTKALLALGVFARDKILRTW